MKRKAVRGVSNRSEADGAEAIGASERSDMGYEKELAMTESGASTSLQHRVK
jgi:hypothetical protein